uniref:Uncharacterized protein n=1 Tax=Oryza meridionalis TaxID=40149 RepID=A0A0E0CZ01_9ORYZ
MLKLHRLKVAAISTCPDQPNEAGDSVTSGNIDVNSNVSSSSSWSLGVFCRVEPWSSSEANFGGIIYVTISLCT